LNRIWCFVFLFLKYLCKYCCWEEVLFISKKSFHSSYYNYINFKGLGCLLFCILFNDAMMASKFISCALTNILSLFKWWWFGGCLNGVFYYSRLTVELGLYAVVSNLVITTIPVFWIFVVTTCYRICHFKVQVFRRWYIII